jgi:hypothetical protein
MALVVRLGLEDSGSSSGRNFGASSLIEFVADVGNAAQRKERSQTPVIVHEYAHYVLGTIPTARLLALRAAVLKAGESAESREESPQLFSQW